MRANVRALTVYIPITSASIRLFLRRLPYEVTIRQNVRNTKPFLRETKETKLNGNKPAKM